MHQKWSQVLSAPPPNRKTKPTAPQRSQNLWGKSAVCEGTRRIRPTQQVRQEIHPRSHWGIFVFLDYAASQDKAIVTYRASDMKLAIHSDASYLSEPKARSRAGGHMFMAGSEEIPINNGAVLNISQIIKAVMSSAAEAELGALFINAKTAVSIRQTLEEMGHPQPRTPIQTDNSTAHALLTNRILPKALKAMDMQFNWLQCRDAQGQFRFYWRPGTQNLADYWTKHHPASHHKSFRPQILISPTDPKYLKLTAPKNTVSKTFVKNILKIPSFAEEIAAK